MARANSRLVNALRTTAARLAGGHEYRWTHSGMCNCGHLAQAVRYRIACADLLEESLDVKRRAA